MNATKTPQEADVNAFTSGDKRRRRSKKEDAPDTTSRLERKRLSDRRSQRAMREKTKQRIAELESALQALLATNVNRELKEKIAENQTLKEEVARLRARLDRIGRLCFAESEGGPPTISDRCRDPSPDQESPKNQENREQAVETLSGRKRRETLHGHNATGFSQDISPSPKSTTNSLENYEGGDTRGYQRPDFLSNDIDPLSANQDDSMSFGDEAFWSVIHGSNLNTYMTPMAGRYSGGQLYDDNQLGSNDFCADFAGHGSLDFADLTAAPQPSPVDAPQSISSSALVNQIRGSTALHPENPTIHVSPGLRSIWTLNSHLMPSSNRRKGFLFEELVKNALEKYKDVSKERLNTILPAVPCMAPFFSSPGCDTSLSRALFEQLRMGSWMEAASFMGAYWCLHNLLRYFLRPVAEEIPYMPSYMLPPTLPVNRPICCWDFLPWPHVRERLISKTSIPSDDGSYMELEGYFGANSTLCWPYTLNEAITFGPPPDLIFGSNGPHTMPRGGGCACSAPQLTDRFKLHLNRAQHWKLKPGSPQILQKYPELRSVVL